MTLIENGVYMSAMDGTQPLPQNLLLPLFLELVF